jgi:hypothetical protein
MNQNAIIIVTSLAIIAVTSGATRIGVYLGKRKINVLAIVSNAKAGLTIFEKVEAVATEFLPEPYKSLANFITDKAKSCVEVAQELADSGSLSNDQRKAKAVELINAALTIEKIPITEKISKAISLTIDLAATLFVPHKSTQTTDDTTAVQSTAAAADPTVQTATV